MGETEEERRDLHICSLLDDGFVEVISFGKELYIDALVRHVGHQYPKAFNSGTGRIERIFHQPNSSWEQRYGRPNVELVIRNHNGTYMFVADYHVEVLEER